MASQNRQERQLMRQRGAGSRNVANADFGLSFNVGGGRQDRQLLRQRGAGRKATSTDFGLSFRTPARSKGSDSKTPAVQTSTSTRSSIRRLRDRSQSATHETSPTASQQVASETVRSFGAQEEVSKEESSAKRRRISTDGNRQNDSINDIRISGQKRVSLGRRASKAAFTIAEEATTELIGDAESNLPSTAGGDSPLVEHNEADKENHTPEAGKILRRRKKRKLIGQRRKKRSSADSLYGVAGPSLSQQVGSGAQITTEVEEERQASEASPEVIDQRDDESGSEQAAEHPPSASRDGKAVGISKEEKQPFTRRARQRSEDIFESLLNGPNVSRRRGGSDAAPIRGTRQTRGPRHAASTSPDRQQADIEDEADEDYVDEDHSPEPPTPAPLKKGGNGPPRGSGRKRNSATGRAASDETDGRRKQTFPIVTHRIVNLGALPTIPEENGTEGESDDETGVNPYNIDRPTPNAVDVLAQICRETIATTAERLANDARVPVGRAELKRKRTALETFGKDLDGRLFEMSASVENRMALESRVRKAKREKADLQARWIEVRKQREETALKCDQVRRQHWQGEHDAEERWRISEAAYRIELEADRNEAVVEEDSLEYLLRSVASDVGSLGSGGGVLERIKTFNARLETIAGVLERAEA